LYGYSPTSLFVTALKLVGFLFEGRVKYLKRREDQNGKLIEHDERQVDLSQFPDWYQEWRELHASGDLAGAMELLAEVAVAEPKKRKRAKRVRGLNALRRKALDAAKKSC